MREPAWINRWTGSGPKASAPGSVSALIPTFNRAGYIQRALDSVLAQTRPVDEIIVLDDGSTDGTRELVEAQYGPRVRVVRRANNNVAAARRQLLLEASCEWIAYLDSDDAWTPDRTGRMLEAAAQHPDVPWIFGDTLVMQDGGKTYRYLEGHWRRWGDDVRRFDDPMPTQYPHQVTLLQSSLVRRSVALELELFDVGFRTGHDDLLAGWKVASRFPMVGVPELVTHFYRTSDLAGSSLAAASWTTPDYHMARIEGYRMLAESGRVGAWRRAYEEAVRGACLALGARGERITGSLAREQFRFGADAKSWVFMAAALCGPAGMRWWERAAGVVRSAASRVRGAARN